MLTCMYMAVAVLSLWDQMISFGTNFTDFGTQRKQDICLLRIARVSYSPKFYCSSGKMIFHFNEFIKQWNSNGKQMCIA
jgi:hypothetical protein